MATIALGTIRRGSPGKESYDEHLHRRLSNRRYCNRFVWNACYESPKAGYYLGESFRSATKNSSTPVHQKNSFFDPATGYDKSRALPQSEHPTPLQISKEGWFRLTTIIRIAEALDVPLSELFAGLEVDDEMKALRKTRRDRQTQVALLKEIDVIERSAQRIKAFVADR